MAKIFVIVCLLTLGMLAHSDTITFKTDVSSSKWQVEGSREACRLFQEVPDYGILGFKQRAGKEIHYVIRTWHDAKPNLKAAIMLIPPSWRHDLKQRNLTEVSLAEGKNILELDTHMTQKLIVALDNGLSVRMTYPLVIGPQDNTYVVETSNVNFREEYNNFKNCVEKLLPYDFEEIAYLSAYFDSESIALTKASQKTLDAIVRYIKAGAELKEVEISGFADKRGRYHYNRKLARARAEAVKSYLLTHEVPEALLKIEDTTRRGGYTYKEEDDDAKNRRVTIRLIH